MSRIIPCESISSFVFVELGHGFVIDQQQPRFQLDFIVCDNMADSHARTAFSERIMGKSLYTKACWVTVSRHEICMGGSEASSLCWCIWMQL